MDKTVEGVKSAAACLRQRHAETLALMPQEAVVAALSELGRRWRDPLYALRREAEGWQEPFPFAMVQVSLDALLDSLTPERLWTLLKAEAAVQCVCWVGAFVLPLITRSRAGAGRLRWFDAVARRHFGAGSCSLR